MPDIASLETQAMKLTKSERAELVDRLQTNLITSKAGYINEYISKAEERLEEYSYGKLKPLNERIIFTSIKRNFAK